MKRTKKYMATAVAMLLLPVCMMAQTNFSKAVEKFVSGKDTHKYIKWANVEENNNPSSIEYFKEYTISIPKTNRKAFQKLHNAIKKDGKTATKVRNYTAGTPRTRERVVYGTDLNKTKEVGRYRDYNLLMVVNTDKKHFMYRNVDVLEWREDNGNVECRITLVRSKDPEKRNNKQNSHSESTPSTRFWTEFSKLQTAFNSEWISQTIPMPEKMKKCGYAATSIMKLCREYSKVLSSDDKQVCREILTDMRRKTQDKYINGMLMLAMKAMM